jgi:CemA family
MTSTFSTKQAHLFEKLKDYLRFASQRVHKTPERALEFAYQSALKIKNIENEYFDSDNSSSDLAPKSHFFTSVLQADIDKNLKITKLRLAEFKASCFLLGNLNPKYLAKLKLVEEIVAKYTKEENNLALEALATTVTIKAEKESINAKKMTGQTGVEQIPVLPTSISRTFKKIKNEFNPKAEEEYAKKIRVSRAKTKIAVKCLLMMIVIPFLTQHFSKQFLVSPLVQQMRGGNHSQVFLNYEMKEEALRELQSFEESVKFENLVKQAPPLSPEVMEEKVKHKAAELVQEYRHKGNSAVSNVFADILGFGAFGLVILLSRKEIVVLKSFMDDIVYGLSDSAKAFIIILFTDMFVGFHSPHGWEVILEGITAHLGIAANRSMIGIFIATFPVILDTICKYWIFRYLSRISPSAVATLRNMNE